MGRYGETQLEFLFKRFTKIIVFSWNKLHKIQSAGKLYIGNGGFARETRDGIAWTSKNYQCLRLFEKIKIDILSVIDQGNVTLITKKKKFDPESLIQNAWTIDICLKFQNYCNFPFFLNFLQMIFNTCTFSRISIWIFEKQITWLRFFI